MEDLQNIKSTIGGVIVVIMVIFLVLLLMHIFQSWEIIKINDRLDKLEPIIDDYCNSNPNRLDFCGEVLKGYNDIGIKFNDP